MIIIGLLLVGVPFLTINKTFAHDWLEISDDTVNALYHLEEDSVDSSGNGFNLTDKNTVNFEQNGKIHYAGDFGTATNNSLYSDPTQLTYSQFPISWSMNFWIYPTHVSVDTHRVLRWITNNGTYEYNIDLVIGTNSKLTFGTYDGTSRTVNQVNTLSINTWYMVTISYDGEQRLYVDGISVGTPLTFSFSSGHNRNTFRAYSLGAEMLNTSDTPTQGFNGLIDEASIHIPALSQDDITSIYASAVGVHICVSEGCGDEGPPATSSSTTFFNNTPVSGLVGGLFFSVILVIVLLLAYTVIKWN